MIILKVISLVILLLILLMSISQFFTSIPPACVLATAFRMPFQYLAQWILTASIIASVLVIIELLRKKINIVPMNIALISILFLITIFSSVYYIRVNTAKSHTYWMESQIKVVKADSTKGTNKSLAYKKVDESSYTGLEQLSIYLPKQGNVQVCLIHINYGGWSVQTKDTGMYMEHLCEKNGYAFVQLAGVGKEKGNLIDIVKSINKGVSYIQNKYDFKSTYLIGSSAGGHLALLSAFSNSTSEMSDIPSIKVDGVIALYTPVDLEYQYIYYVQEHVAKDIFGKLGDKLYCKLFNGTSGTLGGETAKIQEKLLGEYNKDNKFYKLAKVENVIQDKKIPILFIQGEKDCQIGLDDKNNLYKLLDQKKIPYTVLNMPGVDHAYDMVFAEQTIAGKRSTQEIEHWIENMEKIYE